MKIKKGSVTSGRCVLAQNAAKKKFKPFSDENKVQKNQKPVGKVLYNFLEIYMNVSLL